MHIAQLMPLTLTVSCFRNIQIAFTFLAAADPNSPGQRAVKWVWVGVVGWWSGLATAKLHTAIILHI